VSDVLVDILLVEDCKADAYLFRKALEDAGMIAFDVWESGEAAALRAVSLQSLSRVGCLPGLTMDN
jgi:hypothetical protein